VSQDPSSAPARAPRFGWPVRMLLFLVLFHMFFRSTDVLYPWEDWLHELNESEGLPASTRQWRLITTKVSTRLASRVDALSLSTELRRV